jgi:hypothetical protein
MSSPQDENAVPAPLAAALERCEHALSQAEDAVRRRLDAEEAGADLEEELEIMQDDRNRLAQDLDAALARAATIERTRDEVLRRVERASAGVATALGLSAPREEES